MSKHSAKTDHERFCRCGHNETEHESGGGRCRAIEPDRCSCHGYRPGKRSYGKQVTVRMVLSRGRERAAQERQRKIVANAELMSFGPVWTDPREMKRQELTGG